jgi:hypothetical protein
MSNYKTLLLENIEGEYENIQNAGYYSMHVDEFVGQNKGIKKYLLEGIKVFKACMELGRENNWVNDYSISFFICLKDVRIIKNPNEDIISMENLLKIVDKEEMPPEVFITQKAIYTNSYTFIDMRTFCFQKPIVERLFNENFNENIRMDYSFYKVKGEKGYRRNIFIYCNKNNTKKIKYHKKNILKIK